jgi:hypothetical protein
VGEEGEPELQLIVALEAVDVKVNREELRQVEGALINGTCWGE